jgi:hypothetical protein
MQAARHPPPFPPIITDLLIPARGFWSLGDRPKTGTFEPPCCVQARLQFGIGSDRILHLAGWLSGNPRRKPIVELCPKCWELMSSIYIHVGGARYEPGLNCLRCGLDFLRVGGRLAPAETMLARPQPGAFTKAVAGLSAALVRLGGVFTLLAVILGLLYALIRFVHWAWYQ